MSKTIPWHRKTLRNWRWWVTLPVALLVVLPVVIVQWVAERLSDAINACAPAFAELGRWQRSTWSTRPPEDTER